MRRLQKAIHNKVKRYFDKILRDIAKEWSRSEAKK